MTSPENLQLNTDKCGCREVANALAAYGIRHVVASSGSRNAPLLMALNRHGAFRLWPVIDERSAAFVALGLAQERGQAVAAVCTSGTALLNFAPAVAEAYYKHIPLAIISADRPQHLVDQADSQTIRQPGTLANIVAGTFSINGDASGSTDLWHTNRLLNEALTTMLSEPPAPVHINVALNTPLSTEIEVGPEPFRKIDTIRATDDLPLSHYKQLAENLRSKKILIHVADSRPDNRLDRSIASLAVLPNVVVITDPTANIHCSAASYSDAMLADSNSPAPDLLITCGGAPLSARLKEWLRSVHPECWHVGHTRPAIVDTFFSLARSYQLSPSIFFYRLARALKWQADRGNIDSACCVFAREWEQRRRCAHAVAEMADSKPFNAIAAVRRIFEYVPDRWNIQLSNGMTVRHAALAPYWAKHRVDCNRGVSGIDGSTSTAIGASLLYGSPTLLITGDMSAQYDLGALASSLITPKLKIVVINNGGGGIFDVVATTRSLPELPTLIKGDVRLPLQNIAQGYGMEYFRATDYHELDCGMKKLVDETERPMILEVVTDALLDAMILNEILEHAK